MPSKLSSSKCVPLSKTDDMTQRGFSLCVDGRIKVPRMSANLHNSCFRLCAALLALLGRPVSRCWLAHCVKHGGHLSTLHGQPVYAAETSAAAGSRDNSRNIQSWIAAAETFEGGPSLLFRQRQQLVGHIWGAKSPPRTITREGGANGREARKGSPPNSPAGPAPPQGPDPDEDGCHRPCRARRSKISRAPSQADGARPGRLRPISSGSATSNGAGGADVHFSVRPFRTKLWATPLRNSGPFPPPRSTSD